MSLISFRALQIAGGGHLRGCKVVEGFGFPAIQQEFFEHLLRWTVDRIRHYLILRLGCRSLSSCCCCQLCITSARYMMCYWKWPCTAAPSHRNLQILERNVDRDNPKYWYMTWAAATCLLLRFSLFRCLECFHFHMTHCCYNVVIYGPGNQIAKCICGCIWISKRYINETAIRQSSNSTLQAAIGRYNSSACQTHVHFFSARYWRL